MICGSCNLTKAFVVIKANDILREQCIYDWIWNQTINNLWKLLLEDLLEKLVCHFVIYMQNVIGPIAIAFYSSSLSRWWWCRWWWRRQRWWWRNNVWRNISVSEQQGLCCGTYSYCQTPLCQLAENAILKSKTSQRSRCRIKCRDTLLNVYTAFTK